jgi:hypothetical protein
VFARFRRRLDLSNVARTATERFSDRVWNERVMLLALVLAAAFGLLVIGVAVRQRHRAVDLAEPFPHVVGAASAAAAVGYVLGDALATYGTRLGYALLALAVLGTFVAYAVDATPADPAA